jgi:hypothetical protein
MNKLYVSANNILQWTTNQNIAGKTMRVDYWLPSNTTNTPTGSLASISVTGSYTCERNIASINQTVGLLRVQLVNVTDGVVAMTNNLIIEPRGK